MKQTTITKSLGSDDAPFLTPDFFEGGMYRIGERDVSREEWAAAARAHLAAHRESVMLSTAVIEAFKSRAGADGDYQALMEAALFRALHSH
jgi:hypothetical protein